MSCSNLPDGITESMIPGNRPRDVAYEKALEDVNVTEVCAGQQQECDHATCLRTEPDVFCGCYLHVTEINNDDVIVVGKGDSNDCPFYEPAVEARTQSILDNDDDPRNEPEYWEDR